MQHLPEGTTPQVVAEGEGIFFYPWSLWLWLSYSLSSYCAEPLPLGENSASTYAGSCTTSHLFRFLRPQATLSPKNKSHSGSTTVPAIISWGHSGEHGSAAVPSFKSNSGLRHILSCSEIPQCIWSLENQKPQCPLGVDPSLNDQH